MEITDNDFSEEFLKKFGDKEKQYILDFCNTFLRTFPNVIDKQTLLDKINKLKSFKAWDGSKDVEGHCLNDSETGLTNYEDMSIIYRAGLEERDERNTVYHELLHLISYKGETQEKVWGESTHEAGLWMQGFQFPDKEEDRIWFEEKSDLDEVMNEFYAIKMLEKEERYLEKERVLKEPTKLDRSKISTKYHGNGYIDKVFLAELYDEIYGHELLKAKIVSREEFVKKFNKDFKDLKIDISDSFDGESFSKLGIQISESLPRAIKTALDIWKQTTKENVKKNGFNLYNYLESSIRIKKALPNVELNIPTMRGNVNTETLTWIEEIIKQTDEQIIMQQLRPDLVGEQTKTEKIIQKKQFFGVISTLRDNIDNLTREDIENVSYGEMPLYNHSNLSCLVVSAGKKSFMTFASEDEYRGCSEFTNLPKEQTIDIFGDNREVEYATVPTPRHKWSIIRDNKGYIPLTDNPDMKYIDLTNEVYLDGTLVEDSRRNGLQQEYGVPKQQREAVNSMDASKSFKNSLGAKRTNGEPVKRMNDISSSFAESLKKKRTEIGTGETNVQKTKNIIALRRERDRLLRGENLTEEQTKRLQYINEIVAEKQYKNQTGKFTGQNR